MIPNFQSNGFLPAGIHWCTIDDIKNKLCFSDRRIQLFNGFEKAIFSLKKAGCKTVYLDGSFSTSKVNPNDIDVCWDLQDVDLDFLFRIEPLFFNFDFARKFQKNKFGCEFFPTNTIAKPPNTTYINFFQQDKDGNSKGIIGLKI